ncbi:unnamed protein product [Adineta steineri]|uniref:Uncharacterized protein n=1 Tax=Adineta steineri TaxID=433720 RepID=A0A818QQV8_9BILA|nr:unnamed protein product [Adineta steineri]
MKKNSLVQHHQTERGIIDALLKISEIVQKTESSRQHQKSTNKRSKNLVGEGDYNELYDDNEQQQQVPVPPPMRTFDSYVSGFNQQSLRTSSNSNQISTHALNLLENKKRNVQSSPTECTDKSDFKNQECSYKRHYDDVSYSSNEDEDQPTKSTRYHTSHRSDISSQPICEELKTTDNQPTITTLHSQTTINQIKSLVTNTLDDQSSSLIIIPTTSGPITNQQKQQSVPSANNSVNRKTESNTFIDQQLQTTLEKRLRDHLLSTITMNHQQENRLASLTKSETEKLMDKIGLTKQVCNLEYYEKQRELAMLAAKQGNYTLSYSIYTNLLHDSQYDYKLKSEILASRATTSLLDQKCYESIDDCTRAIAFNQWNKLAYVVRAACWMIKQEYSKAVDDYSKLFHFFDQSQHVLDLLNLAYEKFKIVNNQQSIKNDQKPIISTTETGINSTKSTSLTSPTASFIQPAVYLCYPYHAYPSWYSTHNKQQITNKEEIQQPTYTITSTSHTSHLSLNDDQSLLSSKTKQISSKSIHSNNNAILSVIDPISTIERQSSYNNKKSQSNLIWIKKPY